MKKRARPFTKSSKVTGPVATVLAKVCDGTIQPTPPAFARPVSGTWGEFSFDQADADFLFEPGRLQVHLHGFDWMGNPVFRKMMGKLNMPAEFILEDGSVLNARYTALTANATQFQSDPGRGQMTHTIDLRGWRWTSHEEPFAYVGPVQGARVDDANLAINASGRVSATHLRVEANYDLHIVAPKNELPCWWWIRTASRSTWTASQTTSSPWSSPWEGHSGSTT
jgi:hypothetical protein